MGSGLILLAIVGAWLAVLVPMALRRYDTSHIVTVDKFHDAMRVLSRRGTDPEPDPGTPAPAPRVSRVRAVAGSARGVVTTRRGRPPATAAARRRRVLTGLLVLSLGTLAGALLGSTWLLAPHLVVDLLLVAFVVHLRKTAARRADREWRRAMGSGREVDRAAARPAASAATRPAARPAAGTATRPAPRPAVPAVAEPARRVSAPVHVAGIPDRMPPRPAPLAPAMSAAAGSAPTADLPAARGAQGEAWSPVPVPAPTYLSAPVAPRRVVDVTRPGSYAEDGLSDAEREIGIVDEGPDLDEILERRRAVNDW